MHALNVTSKFVHGDRYINSDGYVMITAIGHPRAHNGRFFEHVIVMEKHLGRYLTKGEFVHHKNGVKTDNRIENLQLVSSKEHSDIHGEIKRTGRKCPNCGKSTVHSHGVKRYTLKSGLQRIRQRWYCYNCDRRFTMSPINKQLLGVLRRSRNGVRCPDCSELCKKEGKTNDKTRQVWHCDNCNQYFTRDIIGLKI